MTPPTQDEIRIGGGVARFAKKSIQSAVARALDGDKRDQDMLLNSRFLSVFFGYINEDLERKAAAKRTAKRKRQRAAKAAQAITSTPTVGNVDGLKHHEVTP